MKRRHLLTAGTALMTSPLATPFLSAHAAETPGVTATEIKIGHTNPYSGPASSYSVIGKLHTAYWAMVSAQGGIAGRKINFISLDDVYSPPKTVEVVRRLVEQDEVAFLFNTLGTPTNSAIHRYVNQKKVPHLFIATGADKWGDYKNFPWTIGFQASYRTEAQIYTKYILREKPNAKIGILYQNDDFGKDYPAGVKDILGDNFDKKTVMVSYEPTDATIDSQITSLQASGADAFLCVAIPKFAAQAIRKVHDLGWKPLFVMSNVAISVGTVMVPAGPEKSIGMISTNYLKDSTDPRWVADPGMNEWRDFMNKHMPGADQTDLSYIYAYAVVKTMHRTLVQCGSDFSRENIMKQAANLKDLEVPVLLPGIKVNTSPTNFHPVKALQLIKWDGKTWVPYGDIIEGV
ncbi:MAG: branched-chain amino acid ABC transporter substrate-binding protein [Acetobacteraceae bacterium]|nr:branched-chain amino acid ABC transporter substrate-binding protein [Acetobacteraceae bacterium]